MHSHQSSETGHIHVAPDHVNHGEQEPENAEYWDELYAERDQVWSGLVNEVLADEAAALPPGVALDLGCGEGADAVWLARRGWQVTAVDVSSVALARAARHAEAAGVASRIDFEHRDLTEDLPEGPFDLVSAQFFHSPIAPDRDEVLRQAAARVASGGTLLVVSHASAPPWARHEHHEPFPSAAQTLAALRLDPRGWRVDLAEARTREALGPDGERGTLDDSIVRATRLPATG